MTFEQQCIAHYTGIKRRIAWPAKRPIVMPPPREEKLEKAKWPKRKPHVRATLHNYDEEAIKAMRLRGVTMLAIALHFNIPRKAMESYIARHQARWMAE
jgi:hypothetical protein